MTTILVISYSYLQFGLNLPRYFYLIITEIVLLVFTVCGSYLTEDSGKFSSAKNVIFDYYSYVYYISYQETRCLWKVKPKSDTSVIWLTFAELSLGQTYDAICR